MFRTRTQCELARAGRAVVSASKAKNRAQLLILLESELHRDCLRVRMLGGRGSRVVRGFRVFCVSRRGIKLARIQVAAIGPVAACLIQQARARHYPSREWQLKPALPRITSKSLMFMLPISING